MIVLFLRGGLGNQLFEYSYANILSQITNDKIYISEYYLKKESIYRGIRLNSLNCIGIRVIPRLIDPFFALLEFYRLKKLHKLDANFSRHGKENFIKAANEGLYTTRDNYKIYGYPKCKKKIKIIDGFFQSNETSSPKNDEFFRNVYRVNDDKFNLAKNHKFEKEIINTNSVCLHIRRGDYASAQISSKLLICDYNYYRKAIEYIKNNIDKPIFYCFSDNHKELIWIKDNYKLEQICDVKYVDNDNFDIQDFRLMYNCKHFIISNSTMSYWAQRISNEKDNIVIVPSKFTNEDMDYNDIYSAKMIRM